MFHVKPSAKAVALLIAIVSKKEDKPCPTLMQDPKSTSTPESPKLRSDES